MALVPTLLGRLCSIMTDRVCNTDNMLLYTPENKTQSGIKRRNSKGGSSSNFNVSGPMVNVSNSGAVSITDGVVKVNG
jgi:hypothetical protein